MFADISGFTNLTETLSKLGPEGAELTAFAINRYMELLVTTVSKSGGDIFKFAGDAMIVVWPPSQNEQNDLKNLCRMAIQSAVEIQERLDKTTVLENISLSVKIGFGVGDINIIYVGGVFGRYQQYFIIQFNFQNKYNHRSEYFASGDPLTQAFQSEHHIKQGGQIVVPKVVRELVDQHFNFISIEGTNDSFFFVKEICSDKIKIKAEALLIRNKITVQEFDRIKSSVMMFVPAGLVPYINNDLEQWSSEIRRLTTLFISLGIDLNDASSDQGLLRVQNVIKTVQECVYLHEGSLNKLLMDDKGSTLIVVFGLPPLSHQNDAVRAIMTAFDLQEQLQYIKCKCSIGISTGTAFCGIVGSSGSRREYSVLGDSVNLAARLMQMAISQQEHKILIDEQTAMDAQQKIHSSFFGDKEVKGKSSVVSVYIPMKPKQIRVASDIRTHFQLREFQMSYTKVIINSANSSLPDQQKESQKPNPFIDQQLKEIFGQKQMKSSNVSSQTASNQEIELVIPSRKKTLSQPPNDQMVGLEIQSSQVQQFIESFLNQPDIPQRMMIINGVYGVGKSFLIKSALRNIEQSYTNTYKYGMKFETRISTLNHNTKKQPFNSIQIILKSIFESLADRRNRLANLEFLKELIDSNAHEKLEQFLTEIFGIGDNHEKDKFKQISFNLQKNLNIIQELQNSFKSFLIYLFSLYLEQEPLKYKKQNQQTQVFEELKSNNNLKIAPIILVFEDMQECDEISFKLINTIIKNFVNICVVGLIRTQYLELQAFNPEHEKIQTQIWQKWFLIFQSGVKQFKLINLRGMNQKFQVDSLKKLLSQYFHFESFRLDYEDSRGSNQTIKTLIRSNTLSSVEMLKSMRQTIFRSQSKQSKISDPLLFYESKSELLQRDLSLLMNNYLYIKTGGHPLGLLNLVFTLIQQEYLKLSDKYPVCYITQELMRIIQHEEWIRIEVPLPWVQVGGPILDRLDCVHQLVLKIASIIGDIFDLQTLYKVLPFKKMVNGRKLMTILQVLEQKQVIEYMDGDTDNVFYRFQHPFMRELLYQRITFNQRRQLHRSVAEALQTIPRPFDYSQQKEYKQLELHWFLASQKPSVQLQTFQNPYEGLSLKEKRLIIIKQIKQLVDRVNFDKRVELKTGYLLKRSSKGFSSWSYRFCVLDSQSIKFYKVKTTGVKTEIQYDSVTVISLMRLYEIITTLNTEENIIPMLSIPIPNPIAFIIPNQEPEDKIFSMVVGCSHFIRDGRFYDKQRKLIFEFDNEDEMLEWKTFIEFARTQAIYYEFTMKFGPINFPVSLSGFDIQLTTELKQQQRERMKVGKVEISNNERSLSHRYSSLSKLGNGTSRKSADFQNMNRRGSYLSPIEPNKQDLIILKEKLSLFINKGMLIFFSQLISGLGQNLENQELDRINIGEENHFTNKFQKCFQVKRVKE